jgi:glycopeptide antibiotics resistance protein
VGPMRMLAGLLLGAWLIIGLVLTLQPAHALPSQVVDDNLIPFHTLAIYLRNLDSEFWMRNLFGNLGLLLPLGLLGPMAFPVLARWWLILPLALLISVSIELAQHWIPDRSADIDDVIVNVAGALIGYLMYRILRALRRAPSAA